MKNTNKSIRLIAGLMIFSFLFSAVNVQAQQAKEVKKVKKVRIERETQRKVMRQKEDVHAKLNLSEEQKLKMEELRLKHQKKSQHASNLLKEKSARLQSLKSADSFDKKAIDNVIDDMAKMKAEMMKKRISHEQDVRALLTKEQQVIFDVHKQKRTHERKAQRTGRKAQKGQRKGREAEKKARRERIRSGI